VQHVQVAIDALAIAEVRPFWFQVMDAPRPQRNRIHIDVYVPADQAEARVKAALAASGHIVNDSQAPGTWTVADAEGNEVDVASWA
jgi:4a-hydroxytetrahydrobiopterin dehydratase